MSSEHFMAPSPERVVWWWRCHLRASVLGLIARFRTSTSSSQAQPKGVRAAKSDSPRVENDLERLSST
jgi:hypothetical protein